MSVISREIISDNFLGINLPRGEKSNKEELCAQIDKWKYYLTVECNAKKGDKILIGVVGITTNFLALCFACFELSLVIVVADEHPVRTVSGNKIVNPKIANLMPVDILIWGKTPIASPESIDDTITKFNFFRENCKTYKTVFEFSIYQFPESLEATSCIRPDPSDIIMLTTSSGSTGVAKTIQHTHEFFYHLCRRNAKQFAGNVVHFRNMHHGSSLTVFYLPTLISDLVTGHYFINCSVEEADDFTQQIVNSGIELNHASFPYASFATKFYDYLRETNIKFPNLRLSLLTYISNESKDAVREGYIKEVESIFGSNETAGPVFLSTLNKENLEDFDKKVFYELDDFYTINLDENNLEVKLPVYDTVVKTNDLFEQNDQWFTHIGRSDLLRINDVEIDLKTLNAISERYHNNVLLLTDDLENKLYMLIQKDTYVVDYGVEKLVRNINARLFDAFNSDRISVDKYLVEDASKFLSGIKLDNELIREYFRNHV